MRRKLKNKIALFSAGVLGAGALFALAGCGAVKISVGETIAEGETTIIAHPTKTAAEYTAKENAYILAGKLKSLDSYRSDVEGKVVAMGGLYKQTIADVHIKSGKESYMEALSSSSLVSVGKQAFFTGDKVVMRDSDKKDSFTVTTLQEYRSKIGCEPTALSNYILNEETIKSAELVSRSEGTYTCRYEIDPVKGTSRYAVKMMNFGGLKVAPEFESCTMELTFDEDWNPISLKAEDKYKISKSFLNNVSCTSTLTETFSEIGKDMEIPDAASFRARLGDDVTDIDPDDVEKDELTILADALLNMDLPGGIKICGELTANDRGSLLLSLPVDGWLSFDIEKLASDGLSSAFRGRVSTEIGGVETEFLYPGDGMLYVRVGEAAYRYAIPSSESGTELDDVLRMFRLSAEGGQGNTYAYRLTLGEDLLAPANEAIELLTSSLPDDSPLKGLAINEVGALISIHRQNEKDAGRITGVELSGDFGIASLSAQVVAAEAAETLPNEEALAKYEAVDVEDMAAVLNSVLKMAGNLVNFNVSIRGELTLEAGADRLLSLPVNGWLSLDVEKLTTAGLSGMFSGKLNTEVLGVPVELLYAGDGFLYVQVSGAKYKYALPSRNFDTEIGSILQSFEFSKESENGAIQYYRIALSEEVRSAVNEVIKQITDSLSDDSPLKKIALKEASALFSVRKRGGDLARLTGAQLTIDLGVASLNADVVVAAGGEALPGEEALAKYEAVDVEDMAAVLNSVLKMAGNLVNFNVSIRGELTLEAGADRLLSLPVNGWLSLDVEKLTTAGLSGMFSGKLNTEVLGVPVELLYAGDGFLYVQVSGAKYKYSLSELEENIDIGSLLSIFKLSVTNGSDDIKDYKLYVGEEALTALNEALGAVTESLPADSPWKGLSFDELSASLSVYKKGNDPARLAGAQLVADLGVASLRADVIVQAGGEALPSAEELAKYEEAEFVTLSSNLGALLKMAVGVADFDWSAGMNFTLNVGLDSDANGNFMIIPLPVQLQILPEELLAGNVWGCFRMHVSAGLGLSMFGLPDMEIYYDNGTLYIVNTTKTDDGTVYASSVSSVDVKGALAGLAADNLGAILSGIFGGSDTDIVAFLADAVMSAQLEVVSLEDGTLRYQLNAGDKLTALLGAGYGSIWDALNAADIPSMEAFKPLLMMFFNFDIDRVCLRADFKDGALSALSVRLTNDGTAPLGGGEDFSFVVGMMMGEQAAAGEMDESFAFLTSSLAAYEEGASVREKLASLAANGVRWLGDSYGALLDETEAAYNALSEAAKMTVADYPRLAELRKEWTQLRAPVSQLSALLGELKTYDGMAGMEVLVGAILEQSNPIFDALDERQKEYFGDYAVKEYLAIRTKYEKNVAVPELKAAIDNLNRETYGTAAQLLKAISAAQTKYDGLYETSKELVDNYDKIEAARAVQKEMAKEELNAQIKELLAKLGAVTEKTSYEEMKALRQSVDAVAKAYAALSTEEQAGISDYKAFQTASASFSEVLKERFRAAVKALGTADAIVKGDDTYAKIAEAQAWKSLLNRTELSALETETNILTACANKHLAIETSEVEEKISAIGEVTLTDECYQNILKARAAYEGLREDYLTWISNRNSLAEAEADYVKLSIDALNAETATESEVAAVRALYDSAIAAYENAPALHGSVVSRLKDYQAKLEALEQAFAPAA